MKGNKDRVCVPSRVERYKAQHKPKCNGGAGCRRCWDKYHAVNARERPLQYDDHVR